MYFGSNVPKVAVKDNYPEQNDPLKTGIYIEIKQAQLTR